MSLLKNMELIVDTDSRSSFAYLAIGWVSSEILSPEIVLKELIDETNKVIGTEPLTISDGRDQQMGSLLIILDRESIPWIKYFLHSLDSSESSVTQRFVVSVVASPQIAEIIKPLAVTKRHLFSPSISPSLRREHHGDYEQLLISGADPVLNAGSAATLVAMCILTAPPQSLITQTVPWP